MKPFACFLAALCLAAVCSADTPVAINHIASGREQNTVHSLTAILRNPATSASALVLAVEGDISGGTVTITDDHNNVWTQNGAGSACTSACNSAVNLTNQGIWLFYALNVQLGTQTITMTFSGNTTTVSLSVSEFYNVATSSAFDAFGTASGTGGTSTISWTTGTPVAGDLIYQAAVDVTALVNNVTSITAGSGFTPVHAHREEGLFSQYAVTGTTASFTYVPTTDSWVSAAVALKPGVTPAPGQGIRVLKSEFHQYDATSTVRQFPSVGNLLVFNWTSPDVTITGITDSTGATWTIGCTATAFNGQKSQMLYAINTTASATRTLTATYSGTSAGLNGATLYDVSGASTAPFDNCTTTNGNQLTAGPVDGGTITPSTINGLIINGLTVIWHTLTGVTVPVGAVMTSVMNPLNNNDPADGCTNLTGTAASTLWQDDGHAHFINLTLNEVTFRYPNTGDPSCTTNKGVSGWASTSIAFKAAPVTTRENNRLPPQQRNPRRGGGD